MWRKLPVAVCKQGCCIFLVEYSFKLWTRDLSGCGAISSRRATLSQWIQNTKITFKMWLNYWDELYSTSEEWHWNTFMNISESPHVRFIIPHLSWCMELREARLCCVISGHAPGSLCYDFSSFCWRATMDPSLVVPSTFHNSQRFTFCWTNAMCRHHPHTAPLDPFIAAIQNCVALSTHFLLHLHKDVKKMGACTFPSLGQKWLLSLFE